MDAATVVGHFRDEVVDTEQPYLWSDALVLRYLNEAQIQLCRDTEGIEGVMSLQVPAGQAQVTLDRRILKIRAARLPDRSVSVLSPEETADWRPSTGVPRALIVRSRTKVEVWPVPTEDTVITLDVFRLPLNPVEDPSDELEVDEIHETGLLHFMMYRAYARPDADTMDRTKSEFFRNEFALYCAKAQKEQGRRRHSAGATMFSW